MRGQTETPVRMVFELRQDEAQRLVAEGYHIYYLPDQGMFTGISSASNEKVSPLVTDRVDEAYQLMLSRMVIK